MKQELKVGDHVRDILSDEISIVVKKSGGEIYPLMAEFSSDWLYFTKEGMSNVNHRHPRFVKVEPPKKKVKKTIEAWANVYKYGRVSRYNTKEEADWNADNSRRIACVKLTGEYEIEE